jgi:dihydrofolate synthase/folylpolyglutamate synthase
MLYEEAVRYLLTLGRELAAPSHARAAKFDLHNIRVLAERLGHPQRRYPSVHIAGTNGKGSSAAMIESVLRAAKLRTGLYTSPHLERINERIRINGEDISDAAFADAFTRLHAIIEELLARGPESGGLAAHPTYFECLTAMAFDVFARHTVDFGVFEVGMGGRLDSTNILTPEIAVITQIDFDHESFLGHSIEEIAGEKAGIIKPGAWVVSSAENPAAQAVIAQRCKEQSARLVEVDEMFHVEHLRAEDGCYRATVSPTDSTPPIEIALPLPGRFQIRNALAAIAAARLLAARGFPIEDAAISRGIATVRWPGRLERVHERPAVFLDGTHNPAGARELLAFWQEHFRGRRITLIYGAMRDKAVDEIAGLLFPRAARIIITQPHQPRAISADALAAMTRHLSDHIEVVESPEATMGAAIERAAPDDAIFATGSLYLVGDLRSWWKKHDASLKVGATTPGPC